MYGNEIFQVYIILYNVDGMPVIHAEVSSVWIYIGLKKFQLSNTI